MSFTWDDYRERLPHESTQWASTDRGWCHLEDHPDGPDAPTACGNYLRYPESRGPNGEQYHAVAYVIQGTPNGWTASTSLGSAWFAEVAGCKRFIEGAVREYLSA